jgi:hypothetical protein
VKSRYTVLGKSLREVTEIIIQEQQPGLRSTKGSSKEKHDIKSHLFMHYKQVRSVQYEGSRVFIYLGIGGWSRSRSTVMSSKLPLRTASFTNSFVTLPKLYTEKRLK